MKIVLFKGSKVNGEHAMTKGLRRIFDTDKTTEIERRVNAVEWVNKNKIVMSKELIGFDNVKSIFRMQPEGFIASTYPDGTYDYLCPNDGVIHQLEIKEVETEKPWTIKEINGSEYVEYLNYNGTDKKYNYYKKE